MKSLVRSLDAPLKESKMAAIPYGAFPVTSGTLNSYQSLNEFDRDVDALQVISGQRRMDEALNAATNMLRREKSPARSIVILLTAGRQAQLYRGLPVRDSSKELRDLGSEIYVITIGSEASFDGLRPIVAEPEDIYQVGSFDYLQRKRSPSGGISVVRFLICSLKKDCCLKFLSTEHWCITVNASYYFILLTPVS